MHKLELLQTSFKVGICVSSCGYCKPEFALSLSSLTPYLLEKRVFNDLTEQAFTVRFSVGSSISDNRYLLVRDAIRDNFTHICFIDDDMKFPKHTIHKLASWRQPVVGVNYRRRFQNGGFVSTKIWRNEQKGHQQVITTENSHGLEEVVGMGFGLCLISTEVFKTIPQPWFEFQWDEKEDSYAGEDITFCRLCNSHKIPLYIDHDLSREVSHLGNHSYEWNEPLILPNDEKHE